jgi:RimJ/RimL family protein N-acetyltransferase
MKILLSKSFAITDINRADKSAYLKHFQEKQISDHILDIPFPYTEADAEWWLDYVAKATAKQGRSVDWAIRASDGQLVGGIGFHGFEVGKSHRAELGYWLSRPLWGRGIMTEAARKVCEFAFSELAIIRITANVFHCNTGSARVLGKAEFQLEGRLRKHYRKNGKTFDGLLYGSNAVRS